MKKLKNPPACPRCGAPIKTPNDRVYVDGIAQHKPGQCRGVRRVRADDLLAGRVQHREEPHIGTQVIDASGRVIYDSRAT